MSLFKTYPPSELTLDLLCSMTPRNVLEYIKDMHEAEQLRFKNLRATTMEFITATNEVTDDVIIELKEENKTLKEENEALKKENEALKKEIKTLLGIPTKEEEPAKEEEPFRKLSYDERLAQVEAEKAAEKAWENFKKQREGLWKECVAECNKADFYPHTIQYSEWNVRDEEGEIVAEGDKKPLKKHIMEHHNKGINIRLIAFNKNEEWSLITHFDGKEWVYEEAV